MESTGKNDPLIRIFFLHWPIFVHCNVLWGFFLFVFPLPLWMILTSLAQPLFFILFLTILFLNWFFKSSWSRLVNVWLGHHLVYLMVFSFHLFLLPIKRHQSFGCFVWVYFFFFFFYARCIRQKCSPWRGVSEVRGCPSCFWDPFSMFCSKTLLFAALFPSFIGLSVQVHLAQAHFFRLDLHACFWQILGPKFFGLPMGPLNVSSCFPPYLSWGDQLHFHKAHYVLHHFPPLLIFRRQFTAFNSTFMHVFGKLFGPSSSNCSQAPLM